MNLIHSTEGMSEKSKLSFISAGIVKYRTKDSKQVAVVLGSSLIPFLLLLTLSVYAYQYSKLYSLALAVPAVCFYVRMFAVFHDCAHNSFFKKHFFNKVLGHFIGMFFYTPFEMWRDGHHKHHVNSGNLDKRDENPDVWLMTTKEYQNASFLKKWSYRIFRHPLVYLTLVPIALFLIVFRLPSKYFTARMNINVIILNAFIAAAYVIAAKTIGLEMFILLQLPICIPGFMIGALMFYLQHQFEETYYSRGDEFIFEKASLQGSSFYKFPQFFNWMTGSVAYHHIHHLNPGIPMYNLVKAHEGLQESYPVRKMTFKEGLKTFRLKLWDEDKQRMVPFK